MPERPRIHEAVPLREALKDPIGAYLNRWKAETGASITLDTVSAEHRAEILWEAYQELLKSSEKEPNTQKLQFLAALYANQETRTTYLSGWQKHRAERASFNGTYTEYKRLHHEVSELEREYDEINRRLFSYRSERVSVVDKTLYQRLKRDLELKRAHLSSLLDQYPKLSARVSYDRLSEYNEELSGTEPFIWFPSRRKILEQIEEAALICRPVMLTGETGTGKTSLVKAAALKLTGETVFKNQGGPSTRLQDALGKRMSSKTGETYIEYGPLGQAITGKRTSLDEEPFCQGGLYFDDEFNNRPKEIQMEILKVVSGIRPGQTVRLPLIGQVTVQSNYLFVAAGNPSEKYDREPTDPAVEREFTQVLVDYPEQSLDTPELFEGMVASLMDTNSRLRFAKAEFEPPIEKDRAGKEKTTVIGAIGRNQRNFLADPRAGGVIWRFSQALTELYKSFSRKETVLKHKGEAQYLSRFVLDPGVVFGWCRSAVEQGYQGSFEKYLNEKLEAKLSSLRLKEDAVLAREFFTHFGLLQAWSTDKEKSLAFTNLTPEEVGTLSPRVKYLKSETATEFGATAIINGKPVKYRKEGFPEAPVGQARLEPRVAVAVHKPLTWTLLGQIKSGELIIHSEKAQRDKDRLIAREEFMQWEVKEPEPTERGTEPELFRALRIQEKQRLKEFFNEDLEVPPLPAAVTAERLKRWQEMGYEMRFLPKKKMEESANYPGWKKKPGKRYTPGKQYGMEFFDEAAAIRDLPENQSNPNLAGLEPLDLPGVWVLADIRKKPNYDNGKQTYENDTAMQEFLKGLVAKGIVNQAAKDGRRNFIHPSVFDKPEFWKEFRAFFGLEGVTEAEATIRLPRLIEQNVMGQGPDWDGTNTGEWLAEYYKSGYRLLCGHSGHGGASRGLVRPCLRPCRLSSLGCFLYPGSHWTFVPTIPT